jgi:hypothetical protein
MPTKPALKVLLLGAFAFQCCNFKLSARVHTDVKNGLTINNDGLIYDSYVLEVDHKAQQGNEIFYGQQIVLTLKGVHGFVEEDGKIFPRGNVSFRDPDGQKLKEREYVFPSTSGPQTEQTAELHMDARIPFVPPDKSYSIIFALSDKKGSGKIEAELLVTIRRPAEEAAKITRFGLDCADAIIYSDYGPVQNHEASIGGAVGILFYGVNGLKVIDGKVFLGARITLVDPQTKRAKFQRDFPEISGSPEEAAYQIHLFLEPKGPKIKGDKSIWKFRVWDKRGSGSLEAETLLKLK